jgi:ABC-type uncharacterized transport system ATPase subunit
MTSIEGPGAAIPAAPPPPSEAAALALKAIVKTFGGFVALDGVDFDLRPGELHALLGENGAGKSTLMNVAAGIYTPDSGSIAVGGVVTAISGPAEARALGIGMVHQHYKLVRPFTVIENIMLANPGGSYQQAMERIRRETLAVAASIDFKIDLDRKIETLSTSDQQRVEILRILVAGARVIVLDEPTAVLTDGESRRLFESMRRLAAEGRSIVLVTHKLSEALTYADRITVMRGGRVVARVTPGEVDESALTKLIVGSNVVERSSPATAVGDPVLLVNYVDRIEPDGTTALDGVKFTLRAGEIYGIAGVGGNGQEALVEVLTGLAAPTGGTVRLAGGGDVQGLPPDRLRRLGIGCIPSDRQALALANDLSVSDNFAVNGVVAGRYRKAIAIDRAAMRRDAAEAVRKFEVAGVRGPDLKVGLLSGGNAQKLVIAREFTSAPRVIIAHSPSRGLDVRATAFVHEHLRAARDRGAGVLLISEDLDEILLLADRIGVMSRGRLVAEFDTPDRQAIGRAMVGHA